MDFFFNLKKRDSKSVKGENGRVLILGGSKLYPGSGILAAQAALRSGADLVYLCAPIPVIEKLDDPSIIPIELKGEIFSLSSVNKVLPLLKSMDAVVLGMGMSQQPAVKSFVNSFLEQNSIPAVIDADAIKVLNQRTFQKLKHIVLTPHQKEFQILFNEAPDLQACMSKAFYEKEVVIMLKSAKDYVTDGKRVYINKTGNPGLTVGGSGDIFSWNDWFFYCSR
jgi:hydroxyethylthiazole kinase-like uncharacterized protein yjeF